MNTKENSVLFLSIIESNKGIIYKIANIYCHHVEDRKDLVQEIIVQLWKSFDNYTDQYKYTTWMYRIALNVAISFYRKGYRRKQIAHPLSEGILHIADTNLTNDINEDIGLLQQFIAGLKELDKALLLLYLEEKGYKEIAGIMGISETNVATKIGRVKTLLKKKFSMVKNEQKWKTRKL